MSVESTPENRRRGDYITAGDLQNPLFIHPSDNSGMILTPIQLVGDNYRRWKKSVMKALSVKNKIGLVDGSVVETLENSHQWHRCNDMVCSWLLNSVSKEIYAMLDEYDTAKEMWEDLEESYGQKNGPLIFQIRKEIQTCEQGDANISDYFTKLKGFWQQLSGLTTAVRCKCGKCECNLNLQIESADNEIKLMQFLMGLNAKFDAARRQFLLSTPLPTASQAHSLLIQDEYSSKMKNVDFKTDSTAFSSRKGGERSSDTGSVRKKCQHCNGNHPVEKCWELIGYPAWHSKRKVKPQVSKGSGDQKAKVKEPLANVTNRGSTDGSESTYKMFSNMSEESQKLMSALFNLMDQQRSEVNMSNMAGPCKEEGDGSW